MSAAVDISVVVPFFQSERHIGACVESLLEQDDFGGSCELIFVDSGSTDSSRDILRRYDGLTVLSEATPGAYAARNTGVRRAAATLIAFTDADCTVARDWLRSIRERMREPSTAVMVGRCEYPSGASLALHWLGSYESAKVSYVINHCPPETHFAYGNNMAVRASVFDQLGPFKEWRRAGDTELVHRMARLRPDWRLVYDSSMRVTHLEFLSTRARLRRLWLYRSTNAQIDDFRELGAGSRFGVLKALLNRKGR